MNTLWDVLSALFNKWFSKADTTSTVTTSTATRTDDGVKRLKVSLHIGINNYPNPANRLAGCINDCYDFRDLMKNCFGFDECRTLIDSEATLNNVTNNISELLAKNPDVLVITNSSHGTRMIDNSEDDGYSEAICLYDQLLIDHNFKTILEKANPKTRVTILVDSCHSSGVTREFLAAMNDFTYVSTPKYLPSEDNMEALYVSVFPIKRAVFEPRENMSEALLAGCKSSEFSYDARFNNRPNGAFSYYAIEILKENSFITYENFIEKLNKCLPSGRYPQCPVLECNSTMKNMLIFS